MRNGVLVFLDVEPEHPLSAAYYRGWSEGLIAAGGREMSTDAELNVPDVKFLPAVYMKPSADPGTLSALVRAVDQGAVCAGAWITRQYKIGCDQRREWDPDFIVPATLPVSVPVWLWQWVIDCRNLDLNMANPDLRDGFLERLVLPDRQRCAA
jgi:hypothetical protein